MTTTSVPRTGVLPLDLLTGDLDSFPDTVLFLRELARARRLPLSVPLAFNALAFGYDLDSGRYSPELLDLETLPVVAVNAVVDPLPAGSLARLATGGKPQLCEVVFRHGEHPALSISGTCPPWLSGAPAGAENPALSTSRSDGEGGVVLTERLVVDATALGTGEPSNLRRLLGKTLTNEGHLVVRVSYANDEQAELDDTRLYVSHLLRQRTAEVREALRELGPVDDAQELAKTLHSVFDVLTALLDATCMRRWRETYLHPEVYERWLAGEEDTRGVDPADVERFSRAIARACLPARERRFGLPVARPAYLAIGPALRADIPDPEDSHLPADALRGPRYATTLVCAQLHLVEYLTQEHGGAMAIGGTAVHVRLDDAWQGGGVWRGAVAESVAEELLEEVDLPLALGWLETTGHVEDERGEEGVPVSADEPARGGSPMESEAQQPEALIVGDSTPEEVHAVEQIEEEHEYADGVAVRDHHVDDTTLCWKFVLGPRHLEAGTLPLTPKVAEAMRSELPVDANLQLDVSHPGTELDPRQRRQRTRLDGAKLHGISWPDGMFSGIRLTASWCTDSFQVRVTSTALDEPVDVEGIPIDYLFDSVVLLRYLIDPADEETGEGVLTMSLVRQLFRTFGLRVGPGKPELFIPLTTFVEKVLSENRVDGSGPPSPLDVCDALEEFITDQGAVRLNWGVLLHQDDVQGDWLTPRKTDQADAEWKAESCARGKPASSDLALVLGLHPTPANRPSRAPTADSGVSSSGEDFLRRGHLRSVPMGQQPQQRELAVLYARKMGLDPTTLSPRITFVRESSGKRKHRGRTSEVC
ncbi:hypothetical protein [Saccharothrix luteola]|uniref:hypothetical protein n=1 Tax=Saccharothrix luteola TaxID=2893018 RepID=UPI001E3C6FD9|nr:hypothetical protein [Saccharothrix luteola]MCC8251183.1 hypothetical protein [Saccharothrix luteola]